MEKCFEKDPTMVFRKIAGEYLLVPIRSSMEALDNIYVLNEVAARIWELIDGKRKVNEICQQILEEFETSPEQVLLDTNEFIVQIAAINAIRECK